VRDDDGFETPAPRGNLIGQLLCLAYPKLAVDKDRLAFSIDQGGRYIPAIGRADEDIERQCLGRGSPCALKYAHHEYCPAEDCSANAAAW
jgi:hypothetical protein